VTGVRVPITPHVGRLASSDVAAGGYAPGTVLGGRFRVIGLLGRGGMGEVYRADDLKLGQPVALKFLPKALVDDAVRRERLYAEVRLARQVSHPNVCRVYDISEVEGLPFLTMEFIDGEDLASLLKRIGHLPASKAIEIARQLCAGVSAAHNRGVLHRDLKPANVMLDGRGYVRITDFGLAVATDAADDDSLSGTPLYMSPELLAGQAASVQSDIYALGVVLYELCTGKKPFHARTLAELRHQKEHALPAVPSEIVRDVDPIVERVILRCIDRDARLRPASVLQVAAALPGGDPLAAALAAGETPSPEMVAASVSTEGLRPGAAWALVGATALLAAMTVGLGQRAVMTRRVPLERPPEALTERAQQIIEQTGYAEPPQDHAFTVTYNLAYLDEIEEHDRSSTRWDRVTPNGTIFWYRQSPQPLKRLAFSISLSPRVTRDDPPPITPGEVLVALNGRGQLLELTALPPAVTPSMPPARPFEWSSLFRAAGLDPAEWTETEPEWTPPYGAGERRAWRRMNGADDGQALDRVEAASVAGRPTSFILAYSWRRPGRLEAVPTGVGTRTANVLGIAVTGCAMFGGFVLARQNLRLGRGDRRGAWRLVTAVTIVLSIAWVLDEHHVADTHEWYLFVSFAGRALVIGGLFWATYVAFEPYVRRHWPSTIVAWTRLIGGGVRDPLVGRDVLIGCAVGGALTCLLLIGVLAPSWLGRTAEMPQLPTWRALLGPRQAVSLSLQLGVNALLEAFVALFLLVLMRLICRREWLAAVGTVVLLALPDILLSDDVVIGAIGFLMVYGLAIVLMIRVGLLAVVAMRLSIDLLQVFPTVPSLTPWYAGIGLAGVMLFGTVAALGAVVAVGYSRVQPGTTRYN
jgi:serine/threonine-protein kinase